MTAYSGILGSNTGTEAQIGLADKRGLLVV
jgi:hypothetical protein